MAPTGTDATRRVVFGFLVACGVSLGGTWLASFLAVRQQRDIVELRDDLAERDRDAAARLAPVAASGQDRISAAGWTLAISSVVAVIAGLWLAVGPVAIREALTGRPSRRSEDPKRSSAASPPRDASSRRREGRTSGDEDEAELILSAMKQMSEALGEKVAELSDSQARQSAILAAAADAILTAETDGRLRTMNPAGCAIFEVEPAQVPETELKALLAPDSWLALEAALAALAVSGVETLERREVTGVRRGGGEFAMELAVSRVELADAPLLVVVGRDISERKRIESMKNEFVSTVSHELRTPLTSIGGSLGLVMGGVAGKLPPKAQDLLGIAERNCERLVRLINDILDMEKITSGHVDIPLGTVALEPLLVQAIDVNRPYAEKHGVALRLARVPAGLAVRGNEDRLMQVLSNLISNACKFSPEGETVEVVTLGAGRRVRVEVRDRGPGIREEFRDRIFGRFAQADGSDARVKGGTGLGLAISKALVERMDGAIGFESEVGVGSTFYFEVPRCVTATDPSQDAILVCAGAPARGPALAERFAVAGIAATGVECTAEALAVLDQTRHRALVIDLELDGAGALIEALRAHPRHGPLPIIAMTVEPTDSDPLRGDALRICDFLSKPVDPERLVAAVLQATAGDRPRILHVEDDDDIHSVVRELLGARAEVTHAATLAEARRLLAGQTFDLLLLDVGLPDGSGLDLLPLVGGRTDPVLPVVVFSAVGVDATIASRVAGVMVKSRSTNAELVATVQSVLRDTAVVA